MAMLAVALMLSAPIAREEAMERCAAAVVARLHPDLGMADMTGTTFEGLSAAVVGNDWVVTGTIVELDSAGRIARRFTCRTRGANPPRVALGKGARR